MHAFVFPGQGSQFQGMGKDLADQHQQAAGLFAQVNDILGFSLTRTKRAYGYHQCAYRVVPPCFCLNPAGIDLV